MINVPHNMIKDLKSDGFDDEIKKRLLCLPIRVL